MYVYIARSDNQDPDVFKIGMTTGILERAASAKTWCSPFNTESKSNLITFVFIAKVNPGINELKDLEHQVHEEFKKFRGSWLKYGDSEWFNKPGGFEEVKLYIIQQVWFLEDVTSEIHDYIKRDETSKDKDDFLKLHDYQLSTLDKAVTYYTTETIGKLIWACGLGKTIMALSIAKKLNGKIMCFGVSSRNLQRQAINQIKFMFGEVDIYTVGGLSKNEYSLKNFLVSNSGKIKWIVTTYHSCDTLVDSEVKFDFKIGDESHHLAKLDSKKFSKFHSISASKTLFMTATDLIIEPEKYDPIIFGQIIDTRSVKWAIENKKITDSVIIIIRSTDEEVKSIIKSITSDLEIDEEPFIAAYMTLKSMERYPDLTKVIIYANNINKAKSINKYISIIISSMNFDLYHDSVISEETEDIDYKLNKLSESKKGILVSVYMLGEGTDLPKLNGITISENMNSEIRIVQAALRPNRLDSEYPDKKAYIIMPYIDSGDWNIDNESFKKCRNVISRLRNTEPTFEDKIKLISLSPRNGKFEINDNPLEDIKNLSHLAKLKLRLRKADELDAFKDPRELEYIYQKEHNLIYNFKSQKDYHNRAKENDEHIKEPERYFGKSVWKGWFDFMGINKELFYTLLEWESAIKNYGISCEREYLEQCSKDSKLSMDPEELYDKFGNLENRLGKRKRSPGKF